MSERPSAENVSSPEGRQYHIGLAPGEVAPRIVMVGDPDRVARVVERFDDVRLERRHREYVSATGRYRGLDVTVIGTGIGCDNTEIAVIELLACVERPVLIRIGSSGALQSDIALGDVVITTGAVRLESTSLGFVEEGFPAVAHHEVVLALVSAAEAVHHPYHIGITATASGFYGWQARGGHAVSPRFPDLPERLARQGVLNFEMEASTLLTLATVAGVRAGCVCAVFANRRADRFVAPDERESAESRAIDVGLGALERLAAMDAAAGSRPFHWPSERSGGSATLSGPKDSGKS